MSEDTGDEGSIHGPGSKKEWNRWHEKAFGPSPAPQSISLSTGGVDLPNPQVLAEAVSWAQAHEVSSMEAFAWVEHRKPPSVDLRLAQAALPVVSELLISHDWTARSALIALQINGAQVETDETWESPRPASMSGSPMERR